jgi:hypothetical protein
MLPITHTEAAFLFGVSRNTYKKYFLPKLKPFPYCGHERVWLEDVIAVLNSLNPKTDVEALAQERFAAQCGRRLPLRLIKK